MPQVHLCWRHLLRFPSWHLHLQWELETISLTWCQIYTISTLLTRAMALWHHHCFHSAIWEICCFKLLFRVNANVCLGMNYTRILLRPNDVCRYVYCIVYIAVFAALAVTMHLNVGNNPTHNCLRGSGPPTNTLFVWSTQTVCRLGQPFFCSSLETLPVLFNGVGHVAPKLPLSLWGSGPSPNTWFLVPTRVHNPNGMSIG